MAKVPTALAIKISLKTTGSRSGAILLVSRYVATGHAMKISLKTTGSMPRAMIAMMGMKNRNDTYRWLVGCRARRNQEDASSGQRVSIQDVVRLVREEIWSIGCRGGKLVLE